MISPRLANLSYQLRCAAGRRAYLEVRRLAVELGDAAAGEARGLPAGALGVQEIAGWAKDQLERAEILLRIARASQADELRRVTFLRRYLPGPDPRARRVVGSY